MSDATFYQGESSLDLDEEGNLDVQIAQGLGEQTQLFFASTLHCRAASVFGVY
jgi:hypothetical protein